MVKIISKYPFLPTLPTWGFHQAKEPFGYTKVLISVEEVTNYTKIGKIK